MGWKHAQLPKRDDSRIQASEMKFLRSMIQKTRKDKVRNEKIREQAGINQSLKETITRARLRWFGHVKRMTEGRIAKQWLHTEITGKRPVGRPRKRWLDQVKEDITSKGINWNEVLKEQCYMNRPKWKALVNHTRETGVET